MIDVRAGLLYRDGKLLTPKKARIVWRDGRLYVFTRADAPDAVYDCQDRPEQRGWRRKWHSGLYTIEEKCWTCGGHRRLAMTSERNLNYGD